MPGPMSSFPAYLRLWRPSLIEATQAPVSAGLISRNMMTFAIGYGGAVGITDRRKFIQCAIAGAVGSALGGVAGAADGNRGASQVVATDLAADLIVFSGAGGNVVTLGSRDSGLLMVDTGSADHTAALLEAVQAHTDGDIYLHFPKQNVLVVGDLLSVGRYPVLDYTTGGWISGMADAGKKL